MDILKILFTILIIIFPLNQLARLQVRSEVAITAIDVAVGLIMAIWILRAFRRKSFHRYILSKPIFIFIAVCFLSLVANSTWLKSDELVISSLYILRWLAYACLYFVVKDFDKAFRKIVVFLLIFIGAIIVVGGYIQYFLYPDLRNLYYLGWDEHLYRMFSSFLDPNFAGAFFVLYFVFLSGLLLHFLKIKKRKFSIVLSIGMIFTLLAIYLTYSRSALIMLFASFFIFSILIKRAKPTIILVLASLIFILFSSRNFYIENINLFRVASTEARIDSVKRSIEIIKDNPILGIGFNAYRYAQVRHGFIQGDRDILIHSGAGTDNSFLFILATSGVIGLLSYTYLLFSILKRAYVNYYTTTKKKKVINILPIIVIASLLGIIIDSLFINSLFYPSIMLWMWILTGLTEST